jgi:hypothetical protein
MKMRGGEKRVKKAIRVSITVAIILAIATIGFANATPRLLKECNMVYWTSADPTPHGVAGNQVSNFKLTLNGNTDPNFWYYLNIKFVKPTQPAGYYMFWLTSPPATDTAFWSYWNAKGVNAAATYPNWQYFMWRIIRATGTRLPMFALYSDGAGDYKLCDGLLRFYAGEHLATLRVNGDYPKGTYTFTCNAAVTPTEPYQPMDNVLDGTVMIIEFR